MNRETLKKLSSLRIKESRCLQTAGMNAGAYYLCGYAIECALKARIAKNTRRHDFPDKDLAHQAYTHSLEKLIGLAGLREEFEKDMKTQPQLQLNWMVVKDWSERSRYDSQITRALAKDMYSASVSRKHGVLTWVKKSW
ncbi:MAG: DNA-binding protein [Planctomycetota bacterium]